MAEPNPSLVGDHGCASSGTFRRRSGANGSRIVTLGPVGTSSHDAASYLQMLLVGDDAAALPIELHNTFEEVLEAALQDPARLALVPSAYRDATAFHWHGQLSLLFHFVRGTPRYGLASAGQELREGPVRVAAVPEVEKLYEELAPPTVAARPVDRISARSTRHAAAMVCEGLADVAITNESSRSAAGLEWITSRPGVEIVWLIFGRSEVVT